MVPVSGNFSQLFSAGIELLFFFFYPLRISCHPEKATWDINGIALVPVRFIKNESQLDQTHETFKLWWFRGAAAGPRGPSCIDHVYVGHLASLGPELPVTIDVSNRLWHHDKIGCGAEARDLSGEDAEPHYRARSPWNAPTNCDHHLHHGGLYLAYQNPL